MFSFDEDPTDEEVLLKVSDLLKKQFPSAGYWRELVSRRLEKMAEDLTQRRLVYISSETLEQLRGAEVTEPPSPALEVPCPALEVPSISGWSPPIMYDINQDRMRLVSQQDVALFETVSREWGSLMSSIAKHRETLKVNVAAVAKKYQFDVPQEEVNHEHANQ